MKLSVGQESIPTRGRLVGFEQGRGCCVSGWRQQVLAAWGTQWLLHSGAFCVSPCCWSPLSLSLPPSPPAHRYTGEAMEDEDYEFGDDEDEGGWVGGVWWQEREWCWLGTSQGVFFGGGGTWMRVLCGGSVYVGDEGGSMCFACPLCDSAGA